MPNYRPVRVKFCMQEGKGIAEGQTFLLLGGVMLLEGISSPFDN